MCEEIIQFCSGSTKPLIFSGSILTLLLASALCYTGYSTNALYNDIDPIVAQDKSLSYHLQLVAAIYLLLITLLGSFAAYYDQKHTIRALAIITSVNFVLAVAAILMVPAGPEISSSFSSRLSEATKLYNFTDKYPPQPPLNATTSDLLAMNSTDPAGRRMTRMIGNGVDGLTDGSAYKSSGLVQRQPLNATEATKLWDRLQARGCCGFKNGTEEWKPRGLIPKSCCSNPIEIPNKEQQICEKIDLDHQRPCAEVLESTSFYLLIVLAIIALVNLYLATVTSISTYRTFHYSEANQSAYS